MGERPCCAGSPANSGVGWDSSTSTRSPTCTSSASASFLSLLAHEATYAWQFQNVGRAYVADSLFSQGGAVVANDDRDRAYECTLVRERRFQKCDSDSASPLGS